MPLVPAHEFDIHNGSPMLYNAMDSMLTAEVLGELKSLLPGSNAPPELRGIQLIYDFERALQAPALEMMARGWCVDPMAREQGISEIRQRLERLSLIIDCYVSAIAPGLRSPTKSKNKNNYPKPICLNPDSTEQLQKFFYEIMHIPPRVTHKEGKESRPMDRDTLEHLDKYFLARPVVQAILAYRDAAGQLEVMESQVDPDWRLRTSYNPAATTTGRWCLSPETEILTRNGWISLRDYDGVLPVACWHHDSNKIEFLSVYKTEFDNDEPLIVMQNKSIHAEMTPSHTIPWFSDKWNFHTARASERRTLFRVPLCGWLHSPFELPEKTRVCIMTQADGSVINSRLIRFHFGKPRKLERCRLLLEDAKIPFRFTFSESDSTVYVYVYDPPAWMFEAKRFGPWLLNHDPSAVIKEITHWDGYDDPRQSGIEFYTSSHSDAQWIQTVAHLASRTTKIKIKSVGRHESWATAYRLWIGETNNTRVYPSAYSEGRTCPKVYCLTTPTGYFLIRSGGKISITGNSSSESPTGSGRNIQNIEEDLRYWLIASKGKKLMGADYEQVESNDTAWYCGVLFDDWTLLDNCQNSDPHVATSKLIWPELGWTGDPTQDRKIADRTYYRHHSYRDIAKRARHGSEKGGQAPEIAKQIRVPLPLIREFQAKFFSAYPVLRQFFTWIAGQIQREKYLINSFGRRRDFFGRTDSTDTIKQAIAFMSQSATADRINLALWRIWKHSPELELLAQIHDAIYLERSETSTDEAECAEVFKRHLDVPLHFRNRTLSIRSEIKVGWRWANAEKTNPDGTKTVIWPDGMKKFNGRDTRQRSSHT